MQYFVMTLLAVILSLSCDPALAASKDSKSSMSDADSARMQLMPHISSGMVKSQSMPSAPPAPYAGTVKTDHSAYAARMQASQGQAPQLPAPPPVLSNLALARPLPAPMTAPPAWAQDAYNARFATGLAPFGVSLFQGNFAATYHEGINPQYVIMPGDRIILRIWGAYSYNDIVVVDQQGNIFIPEVGPVAVGGLTNAALPSAVQAQISTVFTDNVNSYTNLMNTQPVGVFVAGQVAQPGRYAGGPQDPVMYYIDRAGGIVPERGSFRKISVKRGKHTVAEVDLYQFMVQGILPGVRLQDGDVILVGNKGTSVGAMGLLRYPAMYEFSEKAIRGAQLLNVIALQPSATHASVIGTRRGAPFHAYLTLQDFSNFTMYDEDVVEFLADRPGHTLMVAAAGAIGDSSRFPVAKGTTLRQLMHYIAVDPELADTESIYLRRRSVAVQQKKAIDESLRRLEQSALTATNSSVDEANIRVREAELIQDFVQRAGKLEPDGVVVVSRKGRLQDLPLEDGDMIYVPQKNNVVQITGEVLVPKAVVFEKKLSLQDYIKSAGGFSDRADTRNVLVLKANGETGTVSSLGIAPGDQLLVVPAYDFKAIQALKDIVQVVYQLAVSTGVVLVPLWR